MDFGKEFEVGMRQMIEESIVAKQNLTDKTLTKREIYALSILNGLISRGTGSRGLDEIDLAIEMAVKLERRLKLKRTDE